MTTRREFLKTGGALAVSFTLPLAGPSLALEAGVPKSQDPSRVGAWLAINGDGSVTIYAGKVELGTGVQTALAQLVAEELNVPVTAVTVKMGDTAIAVDQGPTLGSLSMQSSAVPVRRAAATARVRIVEQAAAAFGVAAAELTAHDGRVFVTARPERGASYRELVPATWTALPVDETIPLKPPRAFEVIGKPVARLELPAKIAGSHPYIQNLRLPGMVHARVIHPPIDGAHLVKFNRESIAAMPGVIDLIVKQNFVAVVCEEESQAVTAARSLDIEWKGSDHAIDSASVYDAMRAEQGDAEALRKAGDPDAVFARAAKRVDAVYRTPYQTHGSIGPSCGVADVRPEGATIWSATQGSFPLRDALAGLLGMPKDKVRVIWAEGAGCYGQNGADDAPAEAAVLSQVLRRPVRVQWMRHDEHGWDPKGPATEMQVKASLGKDGMIESWSYVVSTPTHVSRPSGSAGNLLPGRAMGLPPKPIRIGGDHCARTLYRFPNERVVVRWLPDGPLRPSALRGLGAVPNSFANESVMDELAHLAGRDPIDFRLAHLEDERAQAVLREVKEISDWTNQRMLPPKANARLREGIGVAFARLEPGGAYVATTCSVAVDVQSGDIRVTRVFVAHDCGLIINPDGLRNQIQGCVIQTLSRTLKEEVQFSRKEMISIDWITYPILKFSELPSEVVISLLDRPDLPPVGSGEPTALTIAPAVANAVFHATGKRVRKTPFTPAEFKRSQGV